MNDDSKIGPTLIAKELVTAACDLIYKDSHHWSLRPCPTCQSISIILKIDFGCTKKSKDHFNNPPMSEQSMSEQ